MDYLRDDEDTECEDVTSNDIQLSKNYLDKASRLYEQGKFYDALTFINAAIRHDHDNIISWNLKGLILWSIFESNDFKAGFEYMIVLILHCPLNRKIKQSRTIK